MKRMDSNAVLAQDAADQRNGEPEFTYAKFEPEQAETIDVAFGRHHDARLPDLRVSDGRTDSANAKRLIGRPKDGRVA